MRYICLDVPIQCVDFSIPLRVFNRMIATGNQFDLHSLRYTRNEKPFTQFKSPTK